MISNKSKKQITSVLYQAMAIIIGLVVIIPIIYAFFLSFMPANEIMRRPPKFIPDTWILDNYKFAITASPLMRFMLNSLIIAGIASILRVITSAMAGYAFSFYRFPGRQVLFYVFMGSIMIPSDVVLITNYQMVSKMHLINTYLGMMIIFFCSATNVFLMRQYFLSFSLSIKEAAVIDGSSNLRFFLQILLPISTPVMTTVFISSFISIWNTYLWPMLVTNDNLMRTVQVGVTMLNFPDGASYGPIMAASMIVLLPALVVFLVFRKMIVGGIMGGSVKG